jgi:hypothetical protein
MNPSYKACLVAFLTLVPMCPYAQADVPNDLFADRTVLTGTNVTIEGTNAGAGNEAGEDTGSGIVLWFSSVWYSWTAPTDGVVHLSGSTPIPNFFMSVRAYRGTAVNALTLAPTLSDGGVAVVAGDTIAIQVGSIYYAAWGGGGGTGPFALTLWLEVPAPASLNDVFTNRFPIAAPSSHYEGSIYGAGSEAGEPLPDGGATQTLWWKFIPPANGVLNLILSAPQFTPWLTVYDGTQFQTMTAVAPINGSIYSVRVGEEYSIQMATGYVPGGPSHWIRGSRARLTICSPGASISKPQISPITAISPPPHSNPGNRLHRLPIRSGFPGPRRSPAGQPATKLLLHSSNTSTFTPVQP